MRLKKKPMVARVIFCTYWLSGRAGRENIWLEIMVESQIFSRPARPNSVNMYFAMLNFIGKFRKILLNS